MPLQISKLGSLLLAGMLIVAGCGGGGEGPPPQTIAISVQPAAADLIVRGRLALQPIVTGTTNAAVRYAVDEADGGTVLPNGEYTAPATPGTYHVTLTSEADTTKTVRATVTVLPYGNAISAGPELPEGRSHHQTAVLADESIILVGGSGNAVQRYRPSTGQFEALNAVLSTRRYVHTATALRNGRVLVLGGETSASPSSSALTDVAELYEPVAGPFATLPARMLQRRGDHTATLLSNGNVLIAGGMASGGARPVGTASTEVYSRAAGTFSAGPTMPEARDNHTATVMQDGRVLIVGGQAGCSATSCARLDTALIYSPATNAITATGHLTHARDGHTATVLLDGRVLIAGGSNPAADPLVAEEIASMEIYDPETGMFTPAADMRIPRRSHTATLLNDGRVLLAGGSSLLGAVSARTEIFDPVTGTTAEGPLMSSPRIFHSAHLLPNGKVLIAGGLGQGVTPLRSSDLFH